MIDYYYHIQFGYKNSFVNMECCDCDTISEAKAKFNELKNDSNIAYVMLRKEHCYTVREGRDIYERVEVDAKIAGYFPSTPERNYGLPLQ